MDDAAAVVGVLLLFCGVSVCGWDDGFSWRPPAAMVAFFVAGMSAIFWAAAQLPQ